MQHTKRGEAGFTIIEVLVALTLFAVIILVVLTPLTGLFGLNQRTTGQVSATNLTQRAIEQVRGQWLRNVRYDKACIDTALPSGVTVTTQGEDLSGNLIGSVINLTAPTPNPNVSATCSTTPATATQTNNAPPLRRLTVTATVNGSSSTQTLEVAR